ncbi:MAG: contractile injection system protein, VgrG/Pvc8 family [Gammaproteobacteria bacterium]|nr:contractile injection system protein, VgrG/Pvc8 family [Gammaproteobacteria bacterium]HQT03427.1 contractile injection system protein, VgrG/Pvc8 family [Thiotrichales bacterium]
MTPAFRIVADNKDISAAVKDRLLEMVIIDEAGIESDSIKLSLDDRRGEDGSIAQLPSIGTKLSISLGYLETSLINMGSYVVDEIEIRSPPRTLDVTAKAADMTGAFRSPKTRSWDDMDDSEALTLGKIVSVIAAEHGYIPKVDPAIASIHYDHIDQTEESDMNLLTRLADKVDAIAKPVDGHLLLYDKSSVKSVSGSDVPDMTLTEPQLIEWTYRYSARKPAGKVSHDNSQDTPMVTGGIKAYYWDFAKAERQEITIGTAPFEVLRHVYSTQLDAERAAKSKKNTGERLQGELSFSLLGNASLMAGGILTLGLRSGIPNRWRMTRIEHRLNNAGYVSRVDCERFN